VDVLVLEVESSHEMAEPALADEEKVLASASLHASRRHAQWLAPSVDFLCRQVGVDLRELTGICVDVGPGLFTGLRVGLATAKGLGFALGVPVAGVTSLEVLARQVAALDAPVLRDALIVPVVDARRGGVFATRFAAGDGTSRGEVVQVTQESLWDPAELADSLGSETQPMVIVGNGALRYASLFEGLPRASLASVRLAHPSVEVLAAEGARRLRVGLGVGAGEIAPLYLRDADVRINWETRISPRTSSAVAG